MLSIPLIFQTSSGDTSPGPGSTAGTPLGGTHPPKYGHVVPNRIFVGGIAANVSYNIFDVITVSSIPGDPGQLVHA